MSNRIDHITNTSELHTLRDLQAVIADFLLTKIANAALALRDKDMTWVEIAEILDYDNIDAIRMVAVRYGGRSAK
jgi:hypothetical protein